MNNKKKIIVTKHCLERYQEYCDDRQDRHALIGNLIQRFRQGRILNDPPSWVQAKRPNQKYLRVGKNLVFPLVEEGDRYVALTCLHRQYAEKRKTTKLVNF